MPLDAEQLRQAITELVQSTVHGDAELVGASTEYRRGFTDGMEMVIRSVVVLVLEQILVINRGQR